MKKMALLGLGIFLTFSCAKTKQESQVLNVIATPCVQTKAGDGLSERVDVEFTEKGIQITHFDFEVTCDFTTVQVTHTFINGVLNITQQGTPNEARCKCYTDVSYTIDGISQNEVNVIFINGEQVYCYNGNGQETAGGLSLKSIENKIFILHLPPYFDLNTTDWEPHNIAREQFISLVGSDVTLQQSSDMRWTQGHFYWVVLETKNGQPVSSATIEYFNASPLVATVSHPLEAEDNGIIQGFMNEIAVKLKESTSYEQLQQLSEQYHCVIRREYGNYHFITVPKTSELNVTQILDLFYKTDLFERVQPSFIILNQPNCEEKIILKELKDEPAIIRERCFDHVGKVDAFAFELADKYPELHSLSVVPFGEIPKEYRKEGLSVYISGSVTSCSVINGCSAPNIRLGAINLFELKSIKLRN